MDLRGDLMEISCKEIRDDILKTLKKQVKRLGVSPKFVIITCSNDEASEIYVRNKLKMAKEIGIDVTHYDLNPKDYNQDSLMEFVYNMNYHFDSVMVQLPLDKKFDESEVLKRIHPNKDVDGLTRVQSSKLEYADKNALIPATAKGCYEIIRRHFKRDDLSGLKVLIINRSNLIGIPLSKLLRNKNATVTVSHSKTDKDINLFLWKTQDNYDVIITGIGKTIIDETTFKNKLIIDCGINRDDEGKIRRDVILNPRCDNLLKNTYYGNVGLLTVIMLMVNVIESYKIQQGLD